MTTGGSYLDWQCQVFFKFASEDRNTQQQLGKNKDTLGGLFWGSKSMDCVGWRFVRQNVM